MPGAWESQEAHREHTRHMSSQCQTVEDFAQFVPGQHNINRRPANETPADRRRRLIDKFKRVRAEFTEGTTARVLPMFRKEMTWTQVPLYPPVANRAAHVRRDGFQGHLKSGGVCSGAFLALPLTTSVRAVQAALEFQPNGWMFAPHPVNVDGSASEFPFVLTWFMDGSSDIMDGPSEQMEDEDLEDDENITAFDTYMEGYY